MIEAFTLITKALLALSAVRDFGRLEERDLLELLRSWMT